MCLHLLCILIISATRICLTRLDFDSRSLSHFSLCVPHLIPRLISCRFSFSSHLAQGLTCMLVFAIFSAVLGMFQFGYNTGVINPPQKVI